MAGCAAKDQTSIVTEVLIGSVADRSHFCKDSESEKFLNCTEFFLKLAGNLEET